MSYIESLVSIYEINRERTLVTLDAVQEVDTAAALAWRPGSGRAHIAWQFMHVAVTEEVFATDRLLGSKPGFEDLVPRFRGGSTPDDDIPSLDEIKSVLAESREHLLTTLSSLTDAELQTIPVGMIERGWTLKRTLQIIAWHEAHHQGQAHITLNLFKNQ
jgi:uncharacterized damage-inducible protein DinB